MKKITIYFLLFLLISCSDATLISKDCYTNADSQAFLDYFDFEVGTFWVYTNAQTGETDTVTVVYHSPEGNYEDYNFVYVVKSSREAMYKQYFSESVYNYSSRVSDSECFLRTVSAFTYHQETDHRDNAYQFVFPALVKDSCCAGTEVKVLNVYSNYQIGQQNFEDVIEYWVAETVGNVQDDIGNYDNSRYFVARNVGIVKIMPGGTNEEWDLVDYEIEQ